MNARIKHLIGSFFLTAGLALSGCGTDTAPMASTDADVQPASGSHLFAFTPEGAASAAKIAGIGNYKSKTKTFMTTGTTFNIKHNNITGNTEDNLKLIFSAPAGALTQDTDITMGTYGGPLSQLVVEFQPDGLVFLTDAQLQIQLGPELVDLPTQGLIIYHIHGDGSIDEIIPTIEYQGSVLHLYVDVPGFSKYSSGGGM